MKVWKATWKYYKVVRCGSESVSDSIAAVNVWNGKINKKFEELLNEN